MHIFTPCMLNPVSIEKMHMVELSFLVTHHSHSFVQTELKKREG